MNKCTILKVSFIILTAMPNIGLMAQKNKRYEVSSKISTITPTNLDSKQKGNYDIYGQMEGLKEGEKVTLGTYVNGEVLKGDSAYVKDGKFHLKGEVVDGPLLYNLQFSQHQAKVVRLLIDSSDQITIQSKNIEKIPHSFLDNYIRMEGSRANFSYHRFIPIMEVFSQTHKRLDSDHYLKELRDSVGFDPSTIAGVLAAKDQLNQALYYMNFYNPDTGYLSLAAVPFLVRASGLITDGKHPAILKDIYEHLDERAKRSFHGQALREETKLCVGQPFPAFNLPDVEGKYISSKDVIAKGKVTLVHFWATTSYQRAMFQQELKMMYNKYHDKGFNIIGVSSDTNHIEWKVRVQAEQYPWYNVSDLKGKDGVVGKLYNEYGVPGGENTTNVLIDANGDIIAWDAYGTELQYYLWKVFGE